MRMLMCFFLGGFALTILFPFVIAVIFYPLFAALGSYSTVVRDVEEGSGTAWAQRNPLPQT